VQDDGNVVIYTEGGATAALQMRGMKGVGEGEPLM